VCTQELINRLFVVGFGVVAAAAVAVALYLLLLGTTENSGKKVNVVSGQGCRLTKILHSSTYRNSIEALKNFIPSFFLGFVCLG